MNKDKRIWKRIFLIFLVALATRILLINFCFRDYTNSDGLFYHNIAVNIVLGNGYSNDTKEPFRPFFFREPGYPGFLAGIYFIWNLVGDVGYLDNNFYRGLDHPEIRLAKYAQSVLGAVTCVIFYLTLLLMIRKKYSFIIGLLFSVYIPLAVYSTQIMRETVQTFVVVFMSYCFARFLFSKKLFWLIMCSILVGISNLTLQVTKFVPLLMALYLLIYFRDLKISLKYLSILILITVIVVFPWVYRTYKFYPDLRIIKTLGVSLTHEELEFESALDVLRENKLISAEEMQRQLHAEWFGIDEHQRFQRSFDGYYRDKAASMRSQAHEPFFSTRKLKRLLKNFRMSWIETLWVTQKEGVLHDRPHQVYKQKREYFMLLLSLLGFVFGYAAIPGIILFFRKLFPITMSFVYFISLFYFIGFVPRIMLPIHAYIFMFSSLAFFSFYLRLRRHLSASEAVCTLIRANWRSPSFECEPPD